MKLYSFSILLLVTLVLASGVFLVAGVSFSNSQIDRENKSGQVLGADEVAIQNLLPRSPDIADEYLETFYSVPQIKENVSEIEMPARSVIAIDPVTNFVFFEKDADEPRSIASITKLMTALVFIEHNKGWDNYYKVSYSDQINGGRIYLSIGDRIKIRDLFNLSLVASANSATRALIRSTGFSDDEFIAEMNKMTTRLKLTNTNFVDYTGLSHLNKSTARDVARIVITATSEPSIKEAVSQDSYRFFTYDGRAVKAHTTNMLFNYYPKGNIDMLGGKTGYIEAAGYCFAGKFKNDEDREVVTVVLGDTNHYSRFTDSERLVDWVFENFKW